MKRLSILLASIACAGMPASAQAAHNLGLQFLYKADADQDGNITKKELKDFRSREFPKADRDHDGVISLKDVPARYQGKARSRFETGEVIGAFDVNGDKQVSRHEFENGPTLVFDHADADKDGTVTQSELIAARTASAGG